MNNRKHLGILDNKWVGCLGNHTDWNFTAGFLQRF